MPRPVSTPTGHNSTDGRDERRGLEATLRRCGASSVRGRLPAGRAAFNLDARVAAGRGGRASGRLPGLPRGNALDPPHSWGEAEDRADLRRAPQPPPGAGPAPFDQAAMDRRGGGGRALRRRAGADLPRLGLETGDDRRHSARPEGEAAPFGSPPRDPCSTARGTPGPAGAGRAAKTRAREAGPRAGSRRRKTGPGSREAGADDPRSGKARAGADARDPARDPGGALGELLPAGRRGGLDADRPRRPETRLPG